MSQPKSKKSEHSPGRVPNSTSNESDTKMACFEIAYLNINATAKSKDGLEQIVYAKFLDDNDPRLIFLVTYNESAKTTYMKVVKIE